MAWFILVSVTVPLLPNRSDVTKAYFAAKTKGLLADGLQPGEQTEALELLLRLQSGIMPDIENPPIPAWFKLILFGGLFVAVLLTVRPKVVVGMGRGVDTIKRWRLWLRFVGVTVPGLVFTSFIWPFVEKLIRAAF